MEIAVARLRHQDAHEVIRMRDLKQALRTANDLPNVVGEGACVAAIEDTKSARPCSQKFVDREKRFSVYKKAEDCLLDAAILMPLSTVQPGVALMRKPWKFTRQNKYLLYPYWISEWHK